jgi:hypothetical protein
MALAPYVWSLLQTGLVARCRQVASAGEDGHSFRLGARRTLVAARRPESGSAGRNPAGSARPGAISSAGCPDLCLGTDDAGSGGTPGRLGIAAAAIARRGATVERAGTGAFTRAEWPATVAIPYQPVPSLRIAAADVPGASGCAPTRTGRIAATAAGAAASPVSTEQPIQA